MNRALLVGINAYPNGIPQLQGCLNDVEQVGGLLKDQFGFDGDGAIRTLTDAQATSQAIRDGLTDLVTTARAGDHVVFQFSGHGSQVPDTDGDESDGLDEIICPYDLDWDRPLSDDVLHAIISNVESGVALTVVLDSCHSGTMLRDVRREGRPRSIAAPAHLFAGRLARSRSVHRVGQRAADAGQAVLIAGCRREQTSADTRIDGAYHGAATYALGQALAELPGGSYLDVVQAQRRWLTAHGYEQEPQLEGDSTRFGHAIFS